jgi:hypothetical protein
MIPYLSTTILVSVITIALVDCISIQSANLQSLEIDLPKPMPEKPS